jgi:predicted double-glycine peptidase
MNEKWRRRVGLSLLASAVLAATGGAFAPTPGPAPRLVQSSLQCGHWCVLRCCELFGVRADLATVQKLLPYHPTGHSMAELAEALSVEGLETEGRRESLAALRDHVPCIAHLTQPDHFVVVVSVDDERIHIYDGAGQRTARSLQEFGKRWSGHILSVKRSASAATAQSSPAPTGELPRIQFDALLVDKGMVAARGESVRFHFPFQNVGSADLVVFDVQASCKCLSIEKPTNVVPPGGRAQISVVYQPPKRGGTFQHDVFVQTNVTRRATRLKMVGFADTGIDVVPSRLDLGTVAVGKRHVAHCFVHDAREWQAAAITNVTCSIPGLTATQHSNDDPEVLRTWLPAHFQSLTADRRVRIIELAWTPSAEGPNRVEGKLEIQTTAKGFERLTVPIMAKVVPAIRAYPSLVLFDRAAPAQSVTQSVLLASMIDQPFRIVDVTVDRGKIEAEFPNSFAESAKLNLALPAVAKDALPSRIRVRVELAETSGGLRPPLAGRAVSLELPVFVSAPKVSAR